MLSQYFTVTFLILFSNSVYVRCHGNSSLVYVIDHTPSMGDDIKQVKIGSELILDNVLKTKSSEIANIVLVTFRDPEVKLITITKYPNVFRNALSPLVNIPPLRGDWPEYSLSGMIEGLERSLPNSYMYVFTDASAKDRHRLREVIDLCIKKQTQIFIIVTFSFYKPPNPYSVFKEYYVISEKCNGQTIYINKDDVSKFIDGFTPTVVDPKSVVVRKTIPKQDLNTPIQFNLDDRVEYATVFISGEKVNLEVGRNNFRDTVKATRQMWTDSVKILKVFNTNPGVYEAKVTGASDVTIVVYAKSDFTFKHGFTENPHQSLDQTSTRPVAGEKQHLAVLVTDPDHGVKIERVNILSTKQSILMTIPLKHVDGDFYITDKFVSPNSPFIIQVNGISKQTGTTVLRNSRTVIEPIPAEKPVLIVNSEKITVPEKHEAKISCGVSKGLPHPTITRKFQKNGISTTTLLPESTGILVIEEVSLDNAGIYTCTATNRVGSGHAKIELEVTKVPKVSIEGKPKILVEYGSAHEFTCKVVAHPQPRIIWKNQLGHIIKASQVTTKIYEFTSRFTISNIRDPSQYTCSAENDVGHNSEAVSVSPMSPFVVDSKFEEKSKVKYGKPVKLVCDIKSGLPYERVWFTDKDRELSIKGITRDNDAKEFGINFMDIDLQGMYGCKVWLKSDPKVFIEQRTTLVIDDLSPPSITATQAISNKTFTASCITKGTPKATVNWYNATDKNGQYSNLKVTGEEFKVHNIKLKHTGFYKCVAENAVGKQEEIINLVVEEPPQILTEKTKYVSLVGDSVLEIPCIVTGYPEPTIVWKNTHREIITSGTKYDVKKILNNFYFVIKNPSLNDTNNFICEASNYLGIDSKTYEVFVKDKLDTDENLYGNTHTINIEVNYSEDIKCNTPHLDGKSVIWYKNGLLTNVVGTYYPIKKASVSDDGNYTCRVNKDDGSTSETYKVDVGTKPIFNKDYDSSIMFWSGDENEFVDCSLKSSKPLDQHQTKVEWSYNGNKTGVEGYKHHVLGWGQYICKVSNVFGATERSINVTTDGCIISRKVDIDDNPPLTLSHNVNFESTSSLQNVNKHVFMEIEQNILISCHNSHENNHFRISDDEYLKPACLKEDKFVINDVIYKYSDLKCVKPVKVTIDNTKRTCTHDRSELIKVGFDLGSGDFIETYNVCYDNTLKVPIFAFAKMLPNNLGNEVDYNKWVNIPNYQGVTNNDCTKDSKCCYSKGQLVNAVDVDYGPPQAATFYDYNAVGVWKPCENESRLSWDLIEENVRSLLTSYNRLQVWSGASEYEQQTVGLVPRYLWKVIDNHSVVVYVNNPKPTVNDIKCSPSKEEHRELRDSFTYVCDIEEFSKQFNIPRSIILERVGY